VIEASMVGAIIGIASTEITPFGGVNQSSLKKDGGRQSIEDYLETKYLCLEV
jgi:succinate-semialdehyde dehydrogenase / glutarate-semialdehyde dehydrogenase